MNTAARWVSGKGRKTRTSTLMQTVGWFSAKELIRISTATQTWKLVYLARPERLLSRMQIMNDKTIAVQMPRLQFSSEVFRWRASREWNQLPIQLREVGNLGRFKRLLKVHLKELRDRPPDG